MKKFLGFVFLLGALACAGLTYMVCDGDESFGEFQRCVSSGKLFEGDRLIFLGGIVACLMLAFAFFHEARMKK